MVKSSTFPQSALDALPTEKAGAGYSVAELEDVRPPAALALLTDKSA